jgi:hypothetical protein
MTPCSSDTSPWAIAFEHFVYAQTHPGTSREMSQISVGANDCKDVETLTTRTS